MAYYTHYRIHEIFHLFTQMKTRKEKIALLKHHDSPALRDILRCIFDDTVLFLLPEGTPPYRPNTDTSPPSNLLKQNIKLTYFVKGGKADKVSTVRRERIFLDVLEAIHPEDALVLISAKDKKPPVKGLTKKLVQEAYPNLIVK